MHTVRYFCGIFAVIHTQKIENFVKPTRIVIPKKEYGTAQ